MKASEPSSERGGGNTGNKGPAGQLGAAKAETGTEVPTLPATQQPATSEAQQTLPIKNGAESVLSVKPLGENTDIRSRIESASSREDFILLRDAINANWLRCTMRLLSH